MAVASACLLSHRRSLGPGVPTHLQGPIVESDEREVTPTPTGEGAGEENPGLVLGAAVTLPSSLFAWRRPEWVQCGLRGCLTFFLFPVTRRMTTTRWRLADVDGVTIHCVMDFPSDTVMWVSLPRRLQHDSLSTCRGGHPRRWPVFLGRAGVRGGTFI